MRTTLAFLRPPDVQHALVGIEALQILPRDVVLALVLCEAHHVHPVFGHETVHVGDKLLGFRGHRCCRGEPLSEMASQVPHHATHALQLRHVNVQVQPVDALTLEHDVVSQDFTHAVW